MACASDLTNAQLFQYLEGRDVEGWFKASKPAKFCREDNVELPLHWVETDLFNCMKATVDDYRSQRQGKIFLCCDRQESGKTVASKALIVRIRGYMQENDVAGYPALYVGTSRLSLRAKMRETLGIPASLPDTAGLALIFRFLHGEVLFAARSNSTNWGSSLRSTWLNLRNSCNGSATPAGNPYKNEIGTHPPVIVLDDLMITDELDEAYLRDFYSLTAIYRVSVFVTTDSTDMASFIAAMNGQRRLVPLPGRFRITTGRDQYAVRRIPDFVYAGKLSEVAEDIEWTPEAWPRRRQHDYVLQYYPDEATPNNLGADGCFQFLVDGEIPPLALRRADQHFGATLPPVL